MLGIVTAIGLWLLVFCAVEAFDHWLEEAREAGAVKTK